MKKVKQWIARLLVAVLLVNSVGFQYLPEVVMATEKEEGTVTQDKTSCTEEDALMNSIIPFDSKEQNSYTVETEELSPKEYMVVLNGISLTSETQNVEAPTTLNFDISAAGPEEMFITAIVLQFVSEYTEGVEQDIISLNCYLNDNPWAPGLDGGVLSVPMELSAYINTAEYHLNCVNIDYVIEDTGYCVGYSRDSIDDLTFIGNGWNSEIGSITDEFIYDESADFTVTTSLGKDNVIPSIQSITRVPEDGILPNSEVAYEIGYSEEGSGIRKISLEFSGDSEWEVYEINYDVENAPLGTGTISIKNSYRSTGNYVLKNVYIEDCAGNVRHYFLNEETGTYGCYGNNGFEEWNVDVEEVDLSYVVNANELTEEITAIINSISITGDYAEEKDSLSVVGGIILNIDAVVKAPDGYILDTVYLCFENQETGTMIGISKNIGSEYLQPGLEGATVSFELSLNEYMRLGAYSLVQIDINGYQNTAENWHAVYYREYKDGILKGDFYNDSSYSHYLEYNGLADFTIEENAGEDTEAPKLTALKNITEGTIYRNTQLMFEVGYSDDVSGIKEIRMQYNLQSDNEWDTDEFEITLDMDSALVGTVVMSHQENGSIAGEYTLGYLFLEDYAGNTTNYCMNNGVLCHYDDTTGVYIPVEFSADTSYIIERIPAKDYMPVLTGIELITENKNIEAPTTLSFDISATAPEGVEINDINLEFLSSYEEGESQESIGVSFGFYDEPWKPGLSGDTISVSADLSRYIESLDYYLNYIYIGYVYQDTAYGVNYYRNSIDDTTFTGYGYHDAVGDLSSEYEYNGSADFTVISSVGRDYDAPQIHSIHRVTTGEINQDSEVTYEIQVTENISGICRIELQFEGDTTWEYYEKSYDEDSALTGTNIITITTYNHEIGDYVLKNISVTDQYGNMMEYFLNEETGTYGRYGENGFEAWNVDAEEADLSYTVKAKELTEEMTAIVTGINLSGDFIDKEALSVVGGLTLNVDVSLKAPEGYLLSEMYLVFQHEESGNTIILSKSDWEEEVWLGTDETVVALELPMSKYALTGSYRLVNIKINTWDVNGSWVTMDYNLKEEGVLLGSADNYSGYAHMLECDGSADFVIAENAGADTQAPVLTSLKNVTGTTIYPNSEIIFEVGYTETESGIKRIRLYYKNKDNTYYDEIEYLVSEGVETDGSIRLTSNNMNRPVGEYPLVSVTLEDYAGNETYYYRIDGILGYETETSFVPLNADVELSYVVQQVQAEDYAPIITGIELKTETEIKAPTVMQFDISATAPDDVEITAVTLGFSKEVGTDLDIQMTYEIWNNPWKPGVEGDVLPIYLTLSSYIDISEYYLEYIDIAYEWEDETYWVYGRRNSADSSVFVVNSSYIDQVGHVEYEFTYNENANFTVTEARGADEEAPILTSVNLLTEGTIYVGSEVIFEIGCAETKSSIQKVELMFKNSNGDYEWFELEVEEDEYTGDAISLQVSEIVNNIGEFELRRVQLFDYAGNVATYEYNEEGKFGFYDEYSDFILIDFEIADSYAVELKNYEGLKLISVESAEGVDLQNTVAGDLYDIVIKIQNTSSVDKVIYPEECYVDWGGNYNVSAYGSGDAISLAPGEVANIICTLETSAFWPKGTIGNLYGIYINHMTGNDYEEEYIEIMYTNYGYEPTEENVILDGYDNNYELVDYFCYDGSADFYIATETTPDEEAPIVQSVTVVETEVRVPGQVTFKVEADTGYAKAVSMYLSFYEVGREENWIYTTPYNSELRYSEEDSCYYITYTIPNDTLAGTYKLARFTTSDEVGNYRSYSESASGMVDTDDENLIFTADDLVIAESECKDEDFEEPITTGMKLLTTEVVPGGNVKFEIEVVETSGISQIVFVCYNDMGEYSTFYADGDSSTWSTVEVYSDNQENTTRYIVTVPIQDDCALGTYTVYYMYVTDASVRNNQSYHTYYSGQNIMEGGTVIFTPDNILVFEVIEEQNVIASGYSGDLTWTLFEDGTMKFSGEGVMKNYTYKSEMPWASYKDKITSVVLENGVTRIGAYAFYGMENLVCIEIPATVTTIGDYAFKSCIALNDVMLPENLEKLGESAFYGCENLTSIEIPASLWTIQPYTFKNCTALTSVILKEGNLQKLSDGAFYGTALTELTIPSCLNIIDTYCFKNCDKLTVITLPENGNLKELREAVFYGTAISEITIPEGITKIGPYAFKNCTALTSIELPETLTSVGEASFYDCTALESINLPDTVTTIGNYAFRRCTRLTAVNFGAELTDIGESSFYGCTGLTELVIPDKVITIQGYAFKGCTSVTSVTLSDSLTTIGDSAFHTCTGLKKITIPASVTTIGEYCFSGSYNLWQITFVGNAPTIGSGAFKGLAATAYYPSEDTTWTSDVLQNYGGEVTWKLWAEVAQ